MATAIEGARYLLRPPGIGCPARAWRFWSVSPGRNAPEPHHPARWRQSEPWRQWPAFPIKVSPKSHRSWRG